MKSWKTSQCWPEFYPPPKASDRAQVESKEVRLPYSGLIPLDGQDVQIWGLQGLGPLDILRFTSGLWQLCLISGLRQRLISLIKELNREEPAGLGGPNSERYILDSRGALVERRAVVCRERLILSHCLVLSLLVVRASPKDVKDILTTLKDSVEDISGSANIVKNQITFSLLISLIISLISDALSASPDEMSILSRDASFRRDFHETVMAIGNDQIIEGCMHCVRLAWAVHLMILQDVTDASEINNDVRNINSCLEVVFSNNVFQFLIDKALRTPAYQNDDEDMIYLCSILRSSS
ncbi:nuclear pore complex protein NUP205 [Helianthus annuus]|uniref:nuclear pore complex protein NUP205 n=1 Tax=Helianthus annuus TaxID=4232 RepID=UPI000B8EEE39|nr:nuclear pore complex protein NUP205 [Helianthus annuus]